MVDAAWRDVLDVRGPLRRYAVDLLSLFPRPASRERTLLIGPDPIRVLLIGAGTVMGYGVTSSHEALDGALAEAVHDATGRGVVLENRARADITIEEVRESLGAAGAHTFHVVVWATAYSDVVHRLSMRSWHRALTALVHDLHAGSDAEVVLLQLPHVIGKRPLAALTRRWVARINHEIEAVADSMPHTSVARAAPAEMVAPQDVVLDRAYYRACAQLLLPAVLPQRRSSRAAS